MWEQLKLMKHKEVMRSLLDYTYFPNPTHVQIEPVEICNMNCLFCFSHGSKYDKSKCDFTGGRIFPKTRLISLIGELKELKVKAISLTGLGEPLLHPNIYEIIQKIVDSNIEYSVTTNFSMNIPDIGIELLQKAKWIRCSLNASNKNTYNRVHNPNNSNVFNKVIDNLKRIHSNVGISFVICKENISNIGDIAKLSNKLEVKSLSFRPEDSFERKSKERKYGIRIIEELTQAKRLETNSFKIYENHNRLDEEKKINHFLPCYYSNYSCYVASNGDVYPCCMTRCDKKYVYGNIMKTNFTDFWDSLERKNNWKKLDMRFCPNCRHDQDNQFIDDVYNNADNFI